jgi:very-short-patch-repair endonuclease
MTDQALLDALFFSAECHHGLVLEQRAVAAGLSPPQIRGLVRAGRIERVTRRVLRAPGSPRTDRQRVLAGVMDAAPAGYASGSTAVALWGVTGYQLFPTHVARERGTTGRRSRLAVLHELRDLPGHHATVLDGIPVLRPERAFLDVCRTEHPRRAARTLDDLWRRRLLSGESVAAMVEELGIQGRGGLRLARQLLDERGDDYVPPASNLESRFAEIVARAGLPEMRRQVDSGGDRWVGRVDFRATDLPLIIEVQSETYHSALTDVRDDEVRMAALRAAGYTVVEVTDAQVWHQPDEVVARIRDVVRALTAARNLDRNLAAGRGPDRM